MGVAGGPFATLPTTATAGALPVRLLPILAEVRKVPPHQTPITAPPAAARRRARARWRWLPAPPLLLMNANRNTPLESQSPASDGPGAGNAPPAYHLPALLDETMARLAVRSGGIYVDGTLGDGGHTARILELAAPDGIVLGIDRDPRALDIARQRLHHYGGRLIAAPGSYADLTTIANDRGIAAVDGILLDLGFASRQVDQPGYGFSFQTDEPLDLRYDPAGPTAADLVNSEDADELADLIYRYGEERRSRAIARSIIANRPIHTTGQLAAVVARAVSGGGSNSSGRRGRHPATRIFQALRIAVNQELEHLANGLDAAAELLSPGGRLAVISYHSLEDRIVKRWLDTAAASCICPPELPVCACDHQPKMRLLGRRAVRPTPAEVAANPRSRSARLRTGERIPA